MPVDFSAERWERVRESYRLWWAGELDRPIIPVELRGRDPGRPPPPAPLLTQATCHDLSVPAAGVIDRLDHELSTRLFLGDAYPRVNLDAFGPGILAGMLGARLDNSTGSVWFHPPEVLPLDEVRLEYDPENVWLCRIRELCTAAVDRWEGQVLVGMPDLGGNLDTLASFRPASELAMDLIDRPREVERLLREAHEAWHRVYRELHGILQSDRFGHTDWSGICSDAPSYMLQCDFSYMISPEMFQTFVMPELTASAQRLERSFYHLDGPGQLRHLDCLLGMERLDGVQWVPGAGSPGCARWPEVYRKIAAAGKKIQIVDGGVETIDAIAAQIGTTRGLHHIGIRAGVDEEADLRRALARYGIE